MKNYITQKGIKQVAEITVEINGKQVEITSLCPLRDMIVGGKKYKAITTARIDGKDGYINLDDKPAIRVQIEQLEADNEAAFLRRYAGIDELLDAINARENYHEAMEEMMSDGNNDGVRPPARPQTTVAAARAMYPIAAAYLDILALAEADPASQIGFARRCAGEQALDTLAAMDTVSAQEIQDILAQARQDINSTPATID